MLTGLSEVKIIHGFGEQILALYGALESSFHERTVTVDELDRQTAELGLPGVERRITIGELIRGLKDGVTP